MPIPIQYREAQENIISSYDWTDVASGIGYVNYYLADVTINGGATTYVLIETAIYGNVATKKAHDTTTTFSTSTFNKPAVIGGDVIVDLDLQSDNGVQSTTLSLVSGGTTTQLGTQTSTRAADAGRTNGTYKFTIPKINIKKDDYLTLTIAVWGDLWFDPQVSKPSRVFIPYRIDL